MSDIAPPHLPRHRRAPAQTGRHTDQLAPLLTDQDVATLKHLAVKAWAGIRSGRWDQPRIPRSLLWPREAPPLAVPETLLLKLVAHHLVDPLKRAEDPQHGIQTAVESGLPVQDLLKVDGLHAPATVRR